MFAIAMRLLPRSLRFPVAMAIARAARRFFQMTGAYRKLHALRVDGPFEIALYFLTNAMTAHGTCYDPIVEIEGYEDLIGALADGQGVLLVHPHTLLSHLQFRVFHDRGLAPLGIAADASLRVFGTTKPVDAIVPSSNFLVNVRNRLREGKLVCGMVDRAFHHRDSTIEFETAAGRMIVAVPLLKVALRTGARIGFTGVRIENGRVVSRIVMANADTLESLIDELIGFIRGYADQSRSMAMS